MNTGQMLLVIGALALFSTIALSVNRALFQSELSSIETQAGIVGVSVCQAKLEETVAAGFAAIPIGVSIDTIATHFAEFRCSTQVDYVEAAAPDAAVTGPTSLKRIQVTVVSDYLAESVSLRTLVGDY